MFSDENNSVFVEVVEHRGTSFKGQINILWLFLYLFWGQSFWWSFNIFFLNNFIFDESFWAEEGLNWKLVIINIIDLDSFILWIGSIWRGFWIKAKFHFRERFQKDYNSWKMMVKYANVINFFWISYTTKDLGCLDIDFWYHVAW